METPTLHDLFTIGCLIRVLRCLLSGWKHGNFYAKQKS